MIVESQTPPPIVKSNGERKGSIKEGQPNEISVPIYWDERDKYSKEQWKTLEVVGAEMFGKPIHITEFGTVVINRGHQEAEEKLFDKFIKEIEDKVTKEESAVKYDKESNMFYLIEKEDHFFAPKTFAFKIDVKEEDMIDYAFGKYNNITSKLNELYVKSMTNEERQNMIKQKEDERKAVIKKMNTTHDLPTPAEARIYLDYLEEIEAENNKEIKNSAMNIATSAILPTAGAIGVGAFASTLADATVGWTILCGIAGMFAASSSNDLILSSYKDVEYNRIFPGAITIAYIKKNINEIKAKKESNRMIKMKASKLLEIENVDKMVMAKSYSMEEFDSTLTEEDKLESLNLKNTIMKNLDELVNRINLINPEDKKELLIEVKEILVEYTERYNRIINQDTSIIDLEADNFMKLKVDMLMKIADLESRLAEVRLKDVEVKQVATESRLLTEKIDGFSQLDNLDLELQKVRENANRKVKVKKLEKK